MIESIFDFMLRRPDAVLAIVLGVGAGLWIIGFVLSGFDPSTPAPKKDYSKRLDNNENWMQYYIDASGHWRGPNDYYIDASGHWRAPDDNYIDASGHWRTPDDNYIDASGHWRTPDDNYIDASGNWRQSRRNNNK